MHALFVELPAFERYRDRYLDDDELLRLQAELLRNPTAGDVIEGTGGLRKARFGDRRRGKGKSGGLRIIYYYWTCGPQFWLFTLYDKGETEDLSPQDRAGLKEVLKTRLQRSVQ